MNNLIKVSLRQQAVYIPQKARVIDATEMQETTSLLVANLAKLGFGVSEELLAALNQTNPLFQAHLLGTFREIMGVNKNWTPLVKAWDIPTGETRLDHIITFYANVFQVQGTTLQCGHIIPDGTFPLHRYNGCPFCGTPFEFYELKNYGQGSKLKVLELWTLKEVDKFMADLLASKTALDATQMHSLQLLLQERPLSHVKVGMKETLMAVIDFLIDQEQAESAQALFSSPTDILRYLWYKHTGFLQIIEPKTIIKRKAANQGHMFSPADNSAAGKLLATKDLKLKYGRKEGYRVAKWLNNLELPAEKMAEMMHPKRGMWVRLIRALRLPEFSKREGFEHLKELLDVFYNQNYEVWAGRVNHFRLRSDMEKTLNLLKQRPGLFARSLFSNMLWFGPEGPVQAFAEIIDQVPARLVFTLNMYAQTYFDPIQDRAVKPLGGISKTVPPHILLGLYDNDQLEAMKNAVEDLCLLAMKKRFAKVENPNKTIYIDPALFKIPVSIGDRSEQIQDMPAALMGTRFPVEGDTVRLFMQWGQGLPAQHLDMDLSCFIAYDKKSDYCSYSNLVTTGCKHSGDILQIPHMIGTAEYINLDLKALQKAKAQYVTFTCNAYSNGEITPNLVVGWMNSKHKMKVTKKSGVAYDPSCVQHQVRITCGLTKGLVFGVLDVNAAEIIWLEMPFGGQVVGNMSIITVKAMLKKLDSKLNIGELLKLKAEAQNLRLVEDPEAEAADEIYTQKWAMNSAAVTALLVD